VTGVGTRTIIGGPLTRRLRRFPKPTPVVAPLIASEALKCSRRIAFRLFGVDPDIRYTRAELARFEEGDYIDATAAEVLVAERDAKLQVPFNWLPLLRLKGKADAGYRTVGVARRVVVEVKSINEKGWSRAVGMWNGVPAAPKAEWLLQGGLAACSPSIDAPLVHVVLVDNERDEVAEWLVDVDEPLDLPDWPVEVDWETGEIIRPSVRRMVSASCGARRRCWRRASRGRCRRGWFPVGGWCRSRRRVTRRRRILGSACRCPYQPTCAKWSPYAVPDFGEMAS
jgi:hypothetical protein